MPTGILALALALGQVEEPVAVEVEGAIAHEARHLGQTAGSVR